MSNAVSITNQNWTQEQLKLITDTVARGATQDELKLFLYRCQNMGLDPLKPGQIHFVKYGNSPGTVVVGIEGFRAIAHRTGKISGVKRGVIKDDKGVVIAGWAEVYRGDWKEPAREEVPFSEYNTGKGPWAKLPETMIKKVAEAAALRMAFPDQLGGTYVQEEMHQAEKTAVAPQVLSGGFVEPGNGFQREGYCMPAIAGRLARKMLDDIPMNDLVDFAGAVEGKYEGREMPAKTKEMFDRVVERINELESGEEVIHE